jgi:tRNA dimethylallyltransferase
MAAKPVICLAGPTGAGKTAAALHLARELGGGVVNFDSRQVYRLFPLITAQPSPAEQAVCPHALYGFLECTEKITAGAFADMARSAIDALLQQGLVPLLVGGTGLYLRALLHGLAEIPSVPESVARELQEELEERGLPALRGDLARDDPEYAAKIHPNDTQRTLRALEVHRATGRPLTWWHERPVRPTGLHALKLCMDVDLKRLTPRLARRIEDMVAQGALDEARHAWQACPHPDAPAWSGIGCAELLAWLRNTLDLDEAKALWLRNTRAYAKRQLTWFRKEPGVHWVPPGDLETMLLLARRFLGGAP